MSKKDFEVSIQTNDQNLPSRHKEETMLAVDIRKSALEANTYDATPGGRKNTDRGKEIERRT